MKVRIITPEKVLFEGESESVTFPGINGSFDVLPHHAPLITALQKGIIRYLVNGKEYEQPIDSGFVKIENDIVTVCAEK
ncbi:F0F1 ATP synthase subunit epsilon [Parabacteroides sp. AD58]|uniref:F0F1 ATP synthase subunit epsilon n=1 Tax=Parabacteroides absconsus TaxID=2951805 RepID=A0ABZ2IKQ3_9BACT|nr:F0F1 ATP synthase subunit epsilon [Parabacteroides sp. AD58]MCM6902901.1 F0F1 ATP synthase subunit epsilon [Parabacteroides sp. AD58]